MPRCSIIIPVYNRVDLTCQCLQAIQDCASDRVTYEIIVADDGSTDSTPQLLATYGDQIRVVTLPTNSGFATACNEGAAIATGEYLVFLNNDTVPQPGWLEALVDYARTHRKATIVSSKLLFPNGTIQQVGCIVHHDGTLVYAYRSFSKNHPSVNKSCRFQVVTAACVLIRQEWFEQLEGFDLAFRNGYEDVDLCLRVGERGGEVHYCHQSVLLHLEGATREDQTSATDEYRAIEAERNRQLYLSRWATRLQADDLDYYLEVSKHRTIMLLTVGVSPDHISVYLEDKQLTSVLWLTYSYIKVKLHAKLHAFVYSDNTLPLWLSVLRDGLCVVLFFVHILRHLAHGYTKVRLRAFVYSDNTLPLWLSVLRGGLCVVLFFVQILRFAQMHRKGRSG